MTRAPYRGLGRHALPLLLGACATVVPAVLGAAAYTVRDAAGRSVAIADPGRIVSIGGAVTEILYALGVETRIVAVDATSLHPARALADKPNVGYFRNLSAEGVLGLTPTLVIAVETAGPNETVAVLDAAAVPFVRVPDRHSGDGILDKIRVVAAAAGVGARGECLVRTVTADLDQLQDLRTHVTTPRKVLFVMSLANGRAMVAGRATAADGIIRLAGAANAVGGFDGYKVVSDEAIVQAAPDVVLVMQRGREELDAAAVFAQPALATTPAAARKALVAMDGLYLLGFGPRTALAARDLAVALYPELGRPALPSERDRALDEACRR